ncbi:RNA 2'-phosphotransferase [Myroides marinus]|uniref:RNA 2'-phosphotransferase n=1 Tax=Myroides marinus TaxID=703342 RepID=UPI002574A9F9|nr:RNA 2'-phosphotransferase [Myroides marinus]MDM1384418.1 RNA 2'-phosphotransferase [Myroides marinus]MDM1404259.1 RNA 2'-phosphotransferase [Myroides marinus]
MEETRKKHIGKFLSLVLRHEPSKIGITLDDNGWADVEELISKCAKHRVSFTRKELDEIVETNNKKRYSFNEDETKIRANQGHSIAVDLEFTAIEPPMFLYHGTADRFLNSIEAEGVKKMSRQHVHLSQDKETAINVGSRHGRVVVLTILAGKMYEDGIVFYQSANGVWLTDYIDPKYISK